MFKPLKIALSTLLSILLLAACTTKAPVATPTPSPAVYTSPFPAKEDERFSTSDWYYPAMRRMDNNGVLPAYPGPVFDPFGVMTGASFYDAVARLIGEPSSAFLSGAGYLTLFERISYGRPVPFYLAALVSARVARTPAGVRPNQIEGSPEQIVDYAEEWGLLKGFPETPAHNASLTRAQAAVLLLNIADIWAKSGKDITDVTLYLGGKQDTWDLTHLFASEAAWEKTMQRLSREDIPGLGRYEGKLHEKDELIACMSELQGVNEQVQAVYAYAYLLSDTDTSDAHYTEMADRASRLSLAFYEETAYIQPELVALGKKQFDAYLKDGGLAFLHDTLEDIARFRDYVLEPENESLLAGTNQWSLGNEEIFSKLTYSDNPQEDIVLDAETDAKLDTESYYRAIYGNDAKLREQVVGALLSPFTEKRNTYASLLSSEVNYNIYCARSRGFESALDYDLTFDEIPRAYYDALVDQTRKAIPSFRRYWELKRLALGQDSLSYADTYASITQPSFSYTDIGKAKQTVAIALAPLGRDYADALETVLYGGWIDASVGTARDTSSYTLPVPGLHPYIFLYYLGDTSSLNTLAHESAHAVHMYLSSGHSYYDQDTPVTLVTETAAALNEMLLFDYLYRNAASDNERIALLEQQIGNVNNTFFTQMYFAQFQQKIHEHVRDGGGLSADTLDAAWLSLLKEYHGPEMDFGDYAAGTWAAIPHFYQGFYVYTYAGAQSAACSLFTRLRSGGGDDGKTADSIMALLRAGNTKAPLDILRQAGAPVEGNITGDLVNYYNGLVNELDRLLRSNGRI